MSRAERERQEIASVAAEALRLRKTLAIKPVALAVSRAFRYHPAFDAPVHCYRETYFMGLLRETEVLVGRTGAEQFRMNGEDRLRIAVRKFLRPRIDVNAFALGVGGVE